jgi:hypothetical protein
VIYTTPLKALSNQKVGEMRERFGAERVGLQTGDVSLNPYGQVVVMTTEVLRNIMYRVVEADQGMPHLGVCGSVHLPAFVHMYVREQMSLACARSVGPMDKVSAYGAEDSRFDPWTDRCVWMSGRVLAEPRRAPGMIPSSA